LVEIEALESLAAWDCAAPSPTERALEPELETALRVDCMDELEGVCEAPAAAVSPAAAAAALPLDCTVEFELVSAATPESEPSAAALLSEVALAWPSPEDPAAVPAAVAAAALSPALSALPLASVSAEPPPVVPTLDEVFVVALAVPLGDWDAVL
jgi:hypothetical protein